MLSLASGLDPKCAKAFNCPVINWYLNEFKELVESHGIPIKNIYNMDKKGCQRGGGKKTSCKKNYILEDSMPSISIIVLILSLSQSLRLSVQMTLSSNQALYFWAHLSVLNGLTAIQTLCIIIIIIIYKFLLTVQCCYISKQLDR